MNEPINLYNESSPVYNNNQRAYEHLLRFCHRLNSNLIDIFSARSKHLIIHFLVLSFALFCGSLYASYFGIMTDFNGFFTTRSYIIFSTIAFLSFTFYGKYIAFLLNFSTSFNLGSVIYSTYYFTPVFTVQQLFLILFTLLFEIIFIIFLSEITRISYLLTAGKTYRRNMKFILKSVINITILSLLFYFSSQLLLINF